MSLEPTASSTISAASHSADRIANAVADSASRVQEKVSELGHSTADKLHQTRVATADALDGAVDSLHKKADRASEMGHEGAAQVGIAARYIREHGSKGRDSNSREAFTPNTLSRQPPARPDPDILPHFTLTRARSARISRRKYRTISESSATRIATSATPIPPS